MTYTVITPYGRSEISLSSEPLGKGGEGSVYSVRDHSVEGLDDSDGLVAKIYHEPEANDRSSKIKAMILSPVDSDEIAWPLGAVVDNNGKFLGYVMKKISKKDNREWLYIANTKDRRNVAPDFSLKYAYASVRNLAAAIISVHQAGHYIGDINESNILINSSATVSVVDTDSMQITGRNGEVYRCTVGKPEFTAPELTHGSLRDHERTKETDVFAFAVAAHQLLTGGTTPHQGSFNPDSDDDPPSTVDRIRKGVLPSLDPNGAKKFGFTPRPGSDLGWAPEELKNHLKAFLSVEPSERMRTYTLETLVEFFDSFIPQLKQCSKEKLRWCVSKEDCGVCSLKKSNGQDPWSSVTKPVISQPKLKPIGFYDPSKQTGTQRSAPLPAGVPAALPFVGAQSVHVPTGGSNQQGVSSSHTGYQQPSPAPPQRPSKIKGKITVEYSDGSWGVRPPLTELFKQKPKMALWAIKEEMPVYAKIWWDKNRNPPLLYGSLSIFLVGLLLSVSWFFVTFSFLKNINFNIPEQVIYILSFAPCFTTVFATIFMFLSSFFARKKQVNIETENIFKTILLSFLVLFFWGLPIIIMGLVLVVLGVFNVFRDGAK